MITVSLAIAGAAVLVGVFLIGVMLSSWKSFR